MMDESIQKQYTKAVRDLLDAMEKMAGNNDAVLANQTVGLRDTNKFRIQLDFLTREDVQNNRRALASAIATENWLEGFAMAIKLMLLFA
jgi:hypothetical protein